MILILFMFCGFAGGAAGLVLLGAWWSLHLLFGASPPTEDQSQGLVLGCAMLAVIGSALLAGYVLVKDGG